MIYALFFQKCEKEGVIKISPFCNVAVTSCCQKKWDGEWRLWTMNMWEQFGVSVLLVTGADNCYVLVCLTD